MHRLRYDICDCLRRRHRNPADKLGDLVLAARQLHHRYLLCLLYVSRDCWKDLYVLIIERSV